jgi:hypothetical protein
MKDNDKYIVYFITLCIDISLLGLLLFNKIKTKFDFIYILLILFTHCVFLYSVYYNITKLIDITHIVVPISICISVFLDSFFLKVINLILVIVIQFLWVYKGCCILQTKNITGYGEIISITTFVWTLVLCYNLYHPFT